MHNHHEGNGIALPSVYDLAAERSVIGSCLLHPDAVPEVSFLLPGDFFLTRHQVIFGALQSVHGRAGVSDPIAVADELLRRGQIDEVGGNEALLDLLEGVVTPIGVEHHARIVQQKAAARRLIAVMQEGIQRARDGDDIGDVTAQIAQALKQPEGTDYRSASWTQIAAGNPQEWIVRGWIPEQSIGILFGEPSTGKSFAAIDLSARMTTGRQWHGINVVHGPVLYLAGEGWTGLGGRLAAWQMHHGDNGSVEHPFDVVDGVPPLETAGRGVYVRLLDAFVARHGVAPTMVWVDTLAYGLPGDENSADVVGPALRILSDIRRVYGCSVWAIAHPRKRAPNDEGRAMTVHDLRGHSSLRGNVDGILAVEMVGDGLRRLTAVKVKDGATPEPLAFQLLALNSGRTRRDGTPETSCVVVESAAPAAPDQAAADREAEARHMAAMAAAVERVVDELRSMVSARSKTEVCERITGIRRKTVLAAFDRAVSTKRIRNSGTSREPEFVVG